MAYLSQLSQRQKEYILDHKDGVRPIIRHIGKQDEAFLANEQRTRQSLVAMQLLHYTRPRQDGTVLTKTGRVMFWEIIEYYISQLNGVGYTEKQIEREIDNYLERQMIEAMRKDAQCYEQRTVIARKEDISTMAGQPQSSVKINY